MKIKSPVRCLAVSSAFAISTALSAIPPTFEDSIAALPESAWHPAMCTSDLNGDGVLDCVLSVPRVGIEGDAAIAVCTIGAEQQVLVLDADGAQAGDAPSLSNATDLESLRLGILGCVWCWFKCAKHYLAAGECVNAASAARARCFADEAADPLVIADCLEAARQATLTCIAEVARTAGSCGECVSKCGPQAASVSMPLRLPNN